jgi:hypothetical protein
MSQRAVSVIFFSCLILVSLCCHGGEWTRLSSEEISFSGSIERDELIRFQNIYRSSDTRLIVNSPGGNMEAGLAIGKILIENQGLTVVVKNICASSCANYLFLAGHTKIIDHGVVGFHGNWRAMIKSPNFQRESMQVEPVTRGRLLAYHEQKVHEETEFLRLTGVSQELFDKTQQENDNGLYDIYLPGTRVFARYGVRNVEGEQNLDVLRSLPSVKVFYDCGSD